MIAFVTVKRNTERNKSHPIILYYLPEAKQNRGTKIIGTSRNLISGYFLKVFNFSYVSRFAIYVVSDSLFASIGQQNRIFSPGVVTVAVLLVAHIDGVQRFSDVVTKVVSGRRLCFKRENIESEL